MKAAEIPGFYDAILQRLIRAQEASAMLPPFLDPLTAFVKIIKRWFKKGGLIEEFSHAQGSRQPNILRRNFLGVEPILEELEELPLSDLNALKICHEANRRKMERRFRVSSIIIVASAVLTGIEKLGAPILSIVPRIGSLQQVMPYVWFAVFVFVSLIWIMSHSIVGRLEVFSDLLEIVAQKNSK